MKRKIATLVLISAALSLFFVGSCRRQPSINDYVESLPELPQNIADTLDPKTLATKTSTTFPAPVKGQIVLAPCCQISDRMSLKVNFSCTKCGPLRDFIMAPIGNLVLSDRGQGGGSVSPPANSKVYRLHEVNRRTVLDTMVCMTIDGPWNATLIEDRHCNGYAPVDTLLINACGELYQFVWNGGVANHPPEVHLVSCRQVATIRSPCGGPSTCECDSSTCPQDQPCDCGFSGQWQ